MCEGFDKESKDESLDPSLGQAVRSLLRMADG